MSDTRPAADAEPPPAPGPTAPQISTTSAPLPALQHLWQVNRSVSLALLALFGAIFMLHWASAVFIPLMLGLVLSYALRPAVDRLQQLHIPRAVAAALLMAALVGATGWAVYALSDDATQFVKSLPAAAQKIRQAARASRNQPATAMDKVQKAATQLEQAAKETSSGPPAAAQGVTRVQIERAQFNLKDYLWTSLPGAVAVIGQATVVLFLTFFLLAAGDTFRR